MPKNKVIGAIVFSFLCLLVVLYLGKILIFNHTIHPQPQKIVDKTPNEMKPVELSPQGGISEGNSKFPNISALGGGYYPSEDIIVNHYGIPDFEITTTDKKVTKVLLLLRNINDQTDMHFYNCPNFVVNFEKVTIHSEQTPIGFISIEGAFLPMQNKYWGQPPETAVFKGKLTIEDHGKIIYSKEQNFTYYQGD